MSIKPKDLLNFAKACQKKQDEVFLRSAISRAYYAAYHEVSSKLINPPNLRPSAHENLIKYLRDKHDKYTLPNIYDNLTADAIANMLSLIKRKRHQSDYDLAKTISSSDVLITIYNAEKIVLATNHLVIKTIKK